LLNALAKAVVAEVLLPQPLVRPLVVVAAPGAILESV
jgi:hypothetical protein